jgi:uncharacterized membrane protein YfcA
MSLATVALFVGFGLLIGILFGFFGMGGSFLVTPALLVLGYPATVAVGSGLAFVFGTSVIGALRHRDHGQVDYRLAAVMTVGMTIGIEGGKRAVFLLEALGSADLVVSVAYVGLLAIVGALTMRDARGPATEGEPSTRALVERVQSVRIPPTIALTGTAEGDSPPDRVSAWVVLGLGTGIGVLSGALGVGGGFLLMPAMVYGLGVPAVVAVGTDILQITISGAYGAFTYAQSGAVALPVVGALLAGSALGARIGAGATTLVAEDDVKAYFAAMLLAGSASVATMELADPLGVPALEWVSVALIFGSTLLVSGAIVASALCALPDGASHEWCRLIRA